MSRELSSSRSHYSYRYTRCHPKESNFIFTFTHISRFLHLFYIWYRGGVFEILAFLSKIYLSILVTNYRHLETEYLGHQFNLWLMFSGPVMIFRCVFNVYEINKQTILQSLVQHVCAVLCQHSGSGQRLLSGFVSIGI